MKKKLLIVLLILVCIFGFSMFIPSFLINPTYVSADIEGYAGARFVLTGYNGYYPEHHFLDSNDKSTLVNSKYLSGNTYINAKGQNSSEFNMISGDSTSLFNKTSSGYTYFYPNPEMSQMIERGNLEVNISAGILALANNTRSKVVVYAEYSPKEGDVQRVSISSDRVYSSGVYNPEWVKSSSIYLCDPTAPIKIGFYAKEDSCFLFKSRFLICEPTLNFESEVQYLNFGLSNQIVYPNQTIELSSSNSFSDFPDTSEYFKYYKEIHKISYDITQGSEYVTKIGNFITIKRDIPNGTQIEIVAKCKIRSDITTYKYSTPVILTADTVLINVAITSDFSNPATYTGTGNYYLGQRATLKITPKTDFTFNGWKINNEIVSTELNYSYIVKRNDVIKALFTKNIRIDEIIVNSKTYDGETSVINYNIILSGVENGHDVSINTSDLQLSYSNPNVGSHIPIIFSKNPSLKGSKQSLYNLVNTLFPNTYADITRKDATLKADAKSKIYGELDPELTYVVEGAVGDLAGKLSRSEGYKAGTYEINVGTIKTLNTNYNLTFISNTFTITKREITITGIQKTTKEYDGTDYIETIANLNGVIITDNLSCKITLKFSSKNVVSQELVTPIIELSGDGKDNYELLEFTSEVKCSINKKPITVKADSIEMFYGDNPKELTYSVKGLIGGESLNGDITRQPGSQVDVYAITIGSLSKDNSNYEIDFIPATFTILKRDLTITAAVKTKTYGEDDPEFTYTYSGLVQGDMLTGKLNRTEGEDCGTYLITLGTLSSNNNYNISFTGANLIINKRNVSILVSGKNKEYDGTKNIDYDIEINNLVFNDSFEVSVNVEFKNKDVGENNIIINSYEINGVKKNNYNFKVDLEKETAYITHRIIEVIIKNHQKTYGDNDPELKIQFENKVTDENIIGGCIRSPGEDVGTYVILLNSTIEQDNPNYTFLYDNSALLTINKRNINVTANYVSKVYGSIDPKLTFIHDNFVETSSFTGELDRDSGENVNNYEIAIGTLKLNENYNIKFNSAIFEIKEKPVNIEILNINKYYGDDDPIFHYICNEVENSDNLNLVIYRETGEVTGEYLLWLNKIGNLNYTLNSVNNNAKLTIAKRPITIKAEPKYKIYGEKDPGFNVSIISGQLVFDENFVDIQIGKLNRELGEDINNYEINIGTFSLGENYEITFLGNIFSIFKREIQIKADDISVYYGDTIPNLTFTILSGNLCFEDEFIGSLEGVLGENIGSHEITVGTLDINDNYHIIFTNGILEIKRRPLTIIADEITKIYGEDDPVYTFEIIGDLIGDDILFGELYREGNLNDRQDVGEYKIFSTFTHDKYEINFVEGKLIILRRQIEILTNDIELIYGDPIPDITFEYVGEKLIEDEFTGRLYRVPNNNVGVYEIMCSLSLGRNYDIIYNPRSLTIKPKPISLITPSYEKFYGSVDPTITYEFLDEGKLINGDKFLGGVTREVGKNIGTYRIISTLYNNNYDITFTGGNLTILPKTVYLHASVYDKIYDGSTRAFIKNAYVVGLIDNEILLYYDNFNCANFIMCEPGNDIAVEFQNFRLEGVLANNYILDQSMQATADITYDKLTNEVVVLSSINGTRLEMGTVIESESIQVDMSQIDKTKNLVDAYKLQLKNNDEEFILNGRVLVNLSVENVRIGSNVYVYKLFDGEYKLVKSSYFAGTVSFETDNLGSYIIVCDNLNWIDICFYVSIVVLTLTILIGSLSIYKKKNKKSIKS